MEELIVNGENVLHPADLHRDKAALARIRNGIPTNTNLPFFKEKNWIFDANVKGEDMNGLVSLLQGKFTTIHNTELSLTKVVETFISAFESLDKGYLQGICIAVKAGQEADKQANDALDKIKATLKILKQFKDELKDNTKHLNDIDAMWNDVQDVLEKCCKIEQNLGTESSLIQSTSEKLQKLQNKLNGIKHLYDADKVFYDVNNLNKATKSFSTDIGTIRSDISLLKKDRDDLKRFNHLKDVDDMFADCIQIKKDISQLQHSTDERISGVCDDIQKQNADLTYLESSVSERLSGIDSNVQNISESLAGLKSSAEEQFFKVNGNLKVLGNSITDLGTSVDSRFSEVNENVRGQSEKFTKFETSTQEQFCEAKDNIQELNHKVSGFETSVDERFNTVNRNHDELLNVVYETNNEVESLKAKLRTAYLVIGGTAALAVTQLILNLVGVI